MKEPNGRAPSLDDVSGERRERLRVCEIGLASGKSSSVRVAAELVEDVVLHRPDAQDDLELLRGQERLLVAPLVVDRDAGVRHADEGVEVAEVEQRLGADLLVLDDVPLLAVFLQLREDLL